MPLFLPIYPAHLGSLVFFLLMLYSCFLCCYISVIISSSLHKIYLRLSSMLKWIQALWTASHLFRLAQPLPSIVWQGMRRIVSRVPGEHRSGEGYFRSWLLINITAQFYCGICFISTAPSLRPVHNLCSSLYKMRRWKRKTAMVVFPPPHTLKKSVPILTSLIKIQL